MKINETNVTIMVADMDKAINFYLSLGLVLKQRWENHYAMLTTEGLTIGLHPDDTNDKSNPDSHISIGFMIDDINDAKELLTKNKIEFKFEDGKSGAYCNFADYDGTLLYFTQPKWK